MGKRTIPTGKSCLTSSVLSSFLTVMTVALVFCAACGPLVNDWSGHPTAPRAAYRVNQSTGISSGALLASANFKQLVVEIQSVHGFAPSAEAIAHFQHFLEARLDKPGGITIKLDGEVPSGGTAYSSEGAATIEGRNRRFFPVKDQLTVYVLFLDGASTSDTPSSLTLGMAYANTSIAIFENTLRTEAAKVAGLQTWVAEATILEHEFGHLLGLVHAPLVDLSSHEDLAHPGHCKASGCLMSFGGDTSAILSGLANQQPPALDANCLRDLQCAGGKASDGISCSSPITPSPSPAPSASPSPSPAPSASPSPSPAPSARP